MIHRHQRIAASLFLWIVGTGLCLFVVQTPLFVWFVIPHSLAMFLPHKLRNWHRVAWSVGCLGIVLGVIGDHYYTTMSRYRDYQAKYPIMRLDDRLDFEADAVARWRRQVPEYSQSFPQPQQITKHSSKLNDIEQAEDPVMAGLEYVESDHQDIWRARTFAQLHDEKIAHFEATMGFGVIRMTPVTHLLQSIELEEKESQLRQLQETGFEEESYLEVNGETIQRPQREPSEHESSEASQIAQPNLNDLTKTHFSSVLEFANRGDLGWVTGTKQAAGFRSHGFQRHDPNPRRNQDANEQWSIARLELVSLLKSETPRVYVTNKLPQLDQLKNVPTRALTAFEAEALPKLFRTQDIVVREGSDRVLMLGSLRAAQHCLDCHSVQRGELLGAFSYVLRPAKQERPQPMTQ